VSVLAVVVHVKVGAPGYWNPANGAIAADATRTVIRAGLVDCLTAERAWRGRGVGRVGQGGLLGMAMKGGMAGQALTAAIRYMLSSLPPRRA